MNSLLRFVLLRVEYGSQGTRVVSGRSHKPMLLSSILSPDSFNFSTMIEEVW